MYDISINIISVLAIYELRHHLFVQVFTYVLFARTAHSGILFLDHFSIIHSLLAYRYLHLITSVLI